MCFLLAGKGYDLPALGASYKPYAFSFCPVQASSKERVSLKMMITILSLSFVRHLARNGTPGLLTRAVTPLLKIQNLDLSGQSNQAGKIKVKDGRIVVTRSLMMNHVL